MPSDRTCGRPVRTAGLLLACCGALIACGDRARICVNATCASPFRDAATGPEDAGPADVLARDSNASVDSSAVDRPPPRDSATARDSAARPDRQASTDRASVADAAIADAGPPPTAGWLHTAGRQFLHADGGTWVGRGANIHDTRSCNACAWSAPDVDEVKRRIDVLVDDWKATFMRLDLESYATASGRTHWQSVLDDPGYLQDIEAIVAHIGSKPGVYVLLSLWVSEFFDPLGWPSAHSRQEWQVLADAFVGVPHVMFGLVNEPESNFSGTQDAEVWDAMNQTVAVIRAVEDAASSPHHIVAVQGTGAWARNLGYYVTHPITAGGGDNIAYEIHVYNPEADFDNMLVTPAQTLPVIVGEYGPVAGTMTEADCQALMALVDLQGIPNLAWTFHMRCPPNLIVDNSGGGCGVDMNLQPTAWGSLLMQHLAP